MVESDRVLGVDHSSVGVTPKQGRDHGGYIVEYCLRFVCIPATAINPFIIALPGSREALTRASSPEEAPWFTTGHFHSTIGVNLMAS